MSYILVTNDQDLSTYCKTLSSSDHIAVDTEFKREDTYYPIPCLIQLANSDLTICIDPNEISNFNPLKEILFSEHITKIFHASRQDLEIFYYLFNQVVQPIYDTQIVASLLGFADQIGYANLVKQTLNIELDKSQTRTDWSKRPFTEAQLSYAANDVIYLLQVYRMQIAALEKSEKSEWVSQEFKKLYRESLYKPDPESAWKKIKSAQALPEEQVKVVHSLSVWREKQAIKRNKPRKFILTNAAIMDLAYKMPESLSELGSVNDINKYVVNKYGNELIQILGAPEISDDKTPLTIEKFIVLSNDEKKLLKKLQALIIKIAEENNISASVISNRKELEKVIRGDRDVDILNGWRYQLVGEAIEKLLAVN